MATHDILKFAGSALSMLTDAAYALLNDDGHKAGIASSALENKALKQATLMAGGLAQFIADNQANDIDDDVTTLANLSAYMAVAINAVVVIPANTITKAMMQDDSVGTDEIEDDAITGDKMAPDSVWRVELGDIAVTTAKLDWNAVTQAKMAINSVGEDEIIDGSVSVNKLAINAVTNAKVANNAIGGNEIIDGTVWFQKLSSTTSEDFDVAGRIAKAWGNYSGDVESIRNEFNVSGIVRTGGYANGVFSVTFRKAMANANYVVVLGGNNVLDAPALNEVIAVFDLTTTGFKISTATNGVLNNWGLITFAVFGDLSA